MSKIIKLPYHKQYNGYTCGPATVQMVLEYFDIKKTQHQLAEILETEKEIGTNHSPIIDLFNKENLFCYVNNESNIEEIKYFINLELPIVVNYIEPSSNDGHYSIIKGFKKNIFGFGKEYIILNDPWNGENFSLKIEDFEKRWKSKNANFKKWIMVISKNDFNLGKQFSAKK